MVGNGDVDMTTGQTTDEQTGELRCSCGYLLQGLTEKRCPECGRPFPGKPRRKDHLGWGWGCTVVTVLAVLGFLAIALLLLWGWAWGMEAKRAGVL